MPNFIAGLTGQQCAALLKDGTCQLAQVGLAEQFHANVKSGNRCGALDGEDCSAKRSQESTWQTIRIIAAEFRPGGERES